MGGLANRVAIVTGASRGIGRAIARRLGAAGAAVVAAGAAGPPSSLLPQAPASSANVATRAVNQRSRVLMDLFPSIEPHPATLRETKSTPWSTFGPYT